MSEEIQETEVQNPAAVLKKNRELLVTIKSMQAELEAAKAALQTAETSAQEWRARWHQVAIIEPFDSELDSASAGPAKYLRQELLERGILKMVTGEDRIDRPAWFDLNGEPQEPADVRKFLVDMHDPRLDRMIRSSGASGGGATGNSGAWRPTPDAIEAAHPSAPTPNAAFGLR